MIEHEKHLIFIHIARTGGTSIETSLTGQDWWLFDPDTKHLSASQARKHYGELIWSRYKKFTVVRNPWDRIVSMWATSWWAENNEELKFSQNPRLIKDFILQLSHEKYNSIFYHQILDDKVDYILRFENLALDFSTMLKELNIPDIPLHHVEKSERKPYREYYDDETAELVASIFKKDIELFNYEF